MFSNWHGKMVQAAESGCKCTVIMGGKQYYIQVSYTIQDEVTKEREISAFRRLDDGYKKILITMDRNPLSNLENGYQMMHLFDFLLNDQALETI